jgi:CHAD domain-containing protein
MSVRRVVVQVGVRRAHQVATTHVWGTTNGVTKVHREVEQKFEPGEGVALPPLDALPGVASVDAPGEVDLAAVYFDTPDLVLAGAGITLRRRTGGDDAGWHLKLPAGDGARDEVRKPLGRNTKTVPAALRSLVRVHVRDRSLAPVATLNTHRVVHRLLDAEGRVLAEVCDDAVTANAATPDGADSVSAWREWEVELVDGPPALLEATAEQLSSTGAAAGPAPSKLARVLGDRLPQPAAEPEPLRVDGPAAAVVHARLREQVAVVKVQDPAVRRDEPDSVHQMRVALRRLRSALATFRPLLDREVTDPLRDEAKWIAGLLGDARDAEVISARLGDVVGAEPAELVLGPVAARLEHQLSGTYRDSLARSVEAMDSPRYFALLDDLDRLIASPPWTDRAAEPADDVLPARVRHDWKRLRRLVDEADDATEPGQRDERLHEVRKAAKRVRYAAETLVPVYGKPASRLVKATKKVQSVLGDHHDSVVAQPLLRQFGVQAHLDGENGFTYGRLHALEQARAAETERLYTKAWQKASRKKLRRWLR